MSMQRSIRLSLAGAVALAVFGIASVALAQTMPSSQPPSSQQIYHGTESSTTYPIQNGTLTVDAGMPAHVKNYGPPPSFKALDTNHDGRISATEAQAYPPLDSDFLYASGHGKTISRAQYKNWVNTQH